MPLISELKRRNVFRVAAAYLVAAWLVLQVTDVLASILDLPAWAPKLVFFLVLLGFVAAVVLSWVYEVTDKGIQRETDADHGTEAEKLSSRKLDFAIIGLLAVAVAFLVLDNYLIDAPPWRGADASPSVAVLPFVNRSPLAEDTFFIDGMHDDVLTRLAKLPSFDRVIARTTVERYRDTDKSIAEIGAELAVGAILEGGVQRVGDRIRINVQLIDVEDDSHLWAETYEKDLSLENLFAVQSEIAIEVASALHIVLSEDLSERLQQVPTTSMEAYREFVLGQAETAKRTQSALQDAEARFRRAIDIDPNFAQAYVAVADTLALQWDYESVRKNADLAMQERRKFIDQALSIDPTLGEAYLSLAYLKHQNGLTRLPLEADEAERLFQEVERHFQKGIALSPNYHRAHEWYGVHLWRTGKHNEECLAAFRKALELAPDHAAVRVPIYFTLRRLGRGDEALEALIEGVRQRPDIPTLWRWIGYEYRYSGALGEALRWLLAGRAVAPEHLGIAGSLCEVQLALRDYDAAERCIDRFEREFDPDRSWFHIELAFGRSDFEEARRLLREFYSRTDFSADYRRGLLGYWTLLGDLESAIEILPTIDPELFDEQGSIREDLAFDLEPPITVDDLRDIDVNRLVMMGWWASALYVSGNVDRAYELYDEKLEFRRAALAVEKSIRADGFLWLHPMNAMYAHGIRQDGPLLIKSIRESLDYPYFEWQYDNAPLFDFIRDDPEWIELMNEIKRRVARERQYYEQHKDEPLF
jgi:TolB-like protein